MGKQVEKWEVWWERAVGEYKQPRHMLGALGVSMKWNEINELREQSQLKQLSLELWILSTVEEKLRGWSPRMLTNLDSGGYEGHRSQ